MAQFLHRDSLQILRKGSTFFLAFFWLSGLICGILVFLSAGNSLIPLMRSALSAPVSIVGLLCVSMLPFLLSVFAVFVSNPRLILLVSFGKAFFFSLVSLGVIQAFGSAGWFVRWLLLFSDSVSLPLLYWYWCRYISGSREFCGWETCGVLSLGLLIGSVDYCLVSPFLALLINF